MLFVFLRAHISRVFDHSFVRNTTIGVSWRYLLVTAALPVAYTDTTVAAIDDVTFHRPSSTVPTSYYLSEHRHADCHGGASPARFGYQCSRYSDNKYSNYHRAIPPFSLIEEVAAVYGRYFRSALYKWIFWSRYEYNRGMEKCTMRDFRRSKFYQ